MIWHLSLFLWKEQFHIITLHQRLRPNLIYVRNLLGCDWLMFWGIYIYIYKIYNNIRIFKLIGSQSAYSAWILIRFLIIPHSMQCKKPLFLLQIAHRYSTHNIVITEQQYSSILLHFYRVPELKAINLWFELHFVDGTDYHQIEATSTQTYLHKNSSRVRLINVLRYISNI